ncbi:MAG: hypothetical protein AVDCRST_MAG71-2759 [uncultured Lysobacter sp.]|uniref:Uncharacterized protein n=1 Tax=uncultured Lysobacter sp. TaxID=271060 RepID=A0A6J4MAT4_9GAMM|nr:MAG: hypothetical protein AVDCRST_MAG71-2759 [uncultured Lysobacter sp.]
MQAAGATGPCRELRERSRKRRQCASLRADQRAAVLTRGVLPVAT